MAAHGMRAFVFVVLSLLVKTQAQQGTGEVASTELALGNVQLKLLAADGSAVLTSKNTPPAKLLSSPQVHSKQTIEVSFTVTHSGQDFKPAQVFLAFQEPATNAAAYAVGKAKAKGSYTITAPVSIIQKQLGKQVGEFAVSLIIGDPSVKTGLLWPVGDVELVLAKDAAVAAAAGAPAVAATAAAKTVRNQQVNNAKPVIRHVFRPADKRPPAAVSLAFTGLALLPLAGLLGYVMFGLKANLKAFPRDSVTAWAAMLFHGLLAALLGVYMLFWLKWNLAQTLPVVLGLGVLLALTGNRALSGLATARFSMKKD